MNEARRLLVYEVVRRAARGESNRGISRAMGIAPRTVKKILAREEIRRSQGESALDRELPARRTPRVSKLDAFDDQIAAWLEQHPDLTATRLREKLSGEGFTGGYTIVREHLKALRAQHAVPTRAAQRVETAPGQQGQFDWSPFEIETGEIENVWSYTLSWSRGRSLAADDNQKQTTILRRLHDSFTELGGVPRESVTDTMSGVVDGWECNQPILNIRFVDFAAYYRFAVHVSPRRYPQYKGKVERPFRYIEENFCNGRTFRSREAFREGLAWWRDTHAMQRPHPVTGRTLAEMLAEERPYLQALPRVPYDAFNARAVERILETRFRPRRLAEQIAETTRNQIRDAMREHPVEQRALSSYETLRVGDGFLREPREEDVRDQANDETEPR